MFEFNDNWVEKAMLDDSIVASFLLTLNKKTSSSSSTLSPPFNVHWSIRQRRSNPRSHTSKIKIQSRRASPTTPLSWSPTTSGSAAATTTDGNEESSRFNKLAHTSRSKIDEQSMYQKKIDEQSEGNANKRSRKKRSRPELLEEEQLLLKEERGNNTKKALTSLVSEQVKPFLLPDLNLPLEEEFLV